MVAGTVQGELMERSNEYPDLVTITEVAQALRVTPQAVRDLVASGHVPFLRVGRRYRIPRTWLDERFAAVRRPA